MCHVEKKTILLVTLTNTAVILTASISVNESQYTRVLKITKKGPTYMFRESNVMINFGGYFYKE